MFPTHAAIVVGFFHQPYQQITAAFRPEWQLSLT
ncbi:Uncharacterised protein [Vibrio cholerae]|nr:Uncharacterised protein [Vibrio cholerae]